MLSPCVTDNAELYAIYKVVNNLYCSGKIHQMQSVQDIREKARAHGIKMNALCREAGIQQPQVSRWMSGTVKPLWASVNQLEQALLKLIEQKSPV